MSYTDDEMIRDLEAVVRSTPSKGGKEIARSTLSEALPVATGRVREELDDIEYRRNVLGLEVTVNEVVERIRAVLQRIDSVA